MEIESSRYLSICFENICCIKLILILHSLALNLIPLTHLSPPSHLPPPQKTALILVPSSTIPIPIPKTQTLPVILPIASKPRTSRLIEQKLKNFVSELFIVCVERDGGLAGWQAKEGGRGRRGGEGDR